MREDCPFCKIVRKEIAAQEVLRDEHVVALETAALQGFSDRVPCARKQRRPPSAAALAAAEALRGHPADSAGERVVIDFAAYVTAANAATTTNPLPGKGNR